jgi:hypothetical protein
VNSLEQWRGFATRYHKRALNYRVAVVAAALMTWLPPRIFRDTLEVTAAEIAPTEITEIAATGIAATVIVARVIAGIIA